MEESKGVDGAIRVYKPGEEASIKEFDLKLGAEDQYEYYTPFHAKELIKINATVDKVLFSVFKSPSNLRDAFFKCELCGAIWAGWRGGLRTAPSDDSKVTRYLCPHCGECVLSLGLNS